MMRTSADDGKTWSDAKQLSPAGKYTGLTNGRCIRLRTGRILLEAWQNSGEELRRFARRHDFQPKRLARWVRRLEAEHTVRFHAVRLVQRRPEPEGPIEIELARGQLVRVPRGFEAEDLRRVLAVLGEVERC
jgi:hypothetical protein